MDSMYGYMDKFDRAYEIIEAVTDNKLIKLNYQFDTLMMEHAENLKAIELKVLTESGTDDDLTTLYLAEAEEVKEKGKGILAKIIDAIRAFINRIKTTIFGKKPDNFPDKVEVDGNPDEVVKEGNALINAIKNFFSGDHKGLKIAGVGVAAAGTVAAVTLTGSKIASAYKDLSDVVDAGDKVLEGSQNTAKNTDASPEDMNLFKSLLNKLKTTISKAGSMARTLIGSGKSSFISKEFASAVNKAVDSGKLLRVHIMLKDAILLDLGNPGIFNSREAYAKEKLPNLYDEHDGEELKLNKNDWSKDYFNQQMVILVTNFSKERVDLLRKMAPTLNSMGAFKSDK